MSRLDKLPEIVDKQLDSVGMSHSLKARVRQGIASRQGQKRPLFTRPRFVAVAALVCACVALLLVYKPFGGTLPGETGQPAVTGPDLSLDETPYKMSVTAQTQSPGGVAVSTAFIIETGDLGLTAEALTGGLTVTPHVEYSLTAQGDGQFLLTPLSTLEVGTVYQIAMTGLAGPQGESGTGLSWAFQTESTLRLVSTLPADNSGWVGTDTGIEMTFSRPVADAAGQITIRPETPGRLEYYDHTVVFVPQGGLLPDTLYTVTLSGELTAAAGGSLGESVSFSFRTRADSARAHRLYLNGAFTEAFLTQDPVVVEMVSNSYEEQGDIPVTVTLYGLSPDAYSQMAQKHADALHPYLGESTDHVLETQGLTALYTYEDTVLYSRYLYYVVLPQNPGAGYYLVDIRPQDPGALSNTSVQKLVCVSDLSVYVMSLNGRALVWVNDAATGRPLGDTQVAVELTADVVAASRTDEAGVAALEISAAGQARLPITVTTGDGRQWRDRITLDTQAVQTAQDVYQACLYLDRAAYLPTDTIHFWGVVRARDGQTALPQSVTLSFGALPRQTLTLDEHGVFTGQIAYENLISTWMSAQVMVGEDALTQVSIQIMEYTKPTYTLAMSADKPYYRNGETALITVNAAFFDGTPAAGLELQVGGSGAPTNGATDAQGRLTHVQSFFPYSGTTWHPGGRYVSAQTMGQEDADVYQTLDPIFFPSDYMQEIEVTETAAGPVLTATAHRIDFGGVDAWMAEHPHSLWGPEFRDAIRGEPYSQSFTVEVIENRWVRRVTGEQYDFISKKVVETYTYDRVETLVDTFTLSTAEGLSAPLPYESDPWRYYTLRVTHTTPDIVDMQQIFTLGDSWYYRGGSGGLKRYYLNSDAYQFTQNSQLSATLTDDSGDPITGGRMLYAVSQRDFLYWAQTTGDTLMIDCDERHIPGYVVTAAYFDGRHVYPAGSLWRYYDYSERELDIEITPDKQSYAPGDTATVTVTIRADGAPVAADFVLSVVDEAAFAVQEQYTNLLEQLYSFRYSTPHTFASYVQHSMEGGGYAEEGGEGDAQGFRKDFVDTAAFLAGRTGADGTATLTFKLADNLTAWRITCAAATQDGWAGLARHRAAATLPFFVNVVRNEKYVAGDTVALSVRGAGLSVSQADRVTYEASISGAGLADTLTAAATAGEYTYFNFGKLPVGTYTVQIIARCGELKDAVRYTITVLDSRLEIPAATVTDIQGLAALQSARYPVTLTFFDPALSGYMTALYDLAGLYGQRGDQLLARSAANAMLEGLGLTAYGDTELSGIQRWDGSVALYTYGDADPGLTAYALAACPHLLDRGAAMNYLYTVLYDRSASKEAVAYAYLGLAASGEPVLLDLRARLGEQEALSWNLPLALGLSLMGDRADMARWYEETIAPLLLPYGDDALYLDAPGEATGDVTYTRAQLTAQAAALAASLGHGDAYKLLSYLHQTGTISGNALPVLLALKAGPMPAVSGETALTYTLDGSRVSARLTPAKPVHTVSMNKAQLEEAGFSVQSGRAAVAVQWVGGADALTATLPGERFTVTRRYEPASGGRVAVRISVRVNTQLGTATDSLYQGYYTLTDVLPSGLRFVSASYSSNGGWYLSGEESGRVSFSLDTRRWENGVVTQRQGFEITYYARQALPGEFVAEGAVLQHPATGEALVSEGGVYTTP